jgi:hypothetical protein
MSEPTSLSDLRELLAKGTPGEWSFKQPRSWDKRFCLTEVPEVTFDHDDVDHGRVIADASLIATSHNALPALLEIAEAALRWRDEYHAGQLRHGAAINALLAALDKVKP